MHQRHLEVPAERLHHLLGLVLAQQPVVDEHAGELVADRLVHEERRHRRVDAARQPADDPLGADLRTDALDLLLDHGGGRPRRRRAHDVVEEVLQDLLPVRRVHHLGVELHRVQPASGVLEPGHRGRRRAGGDVRARRRRDDRVVVAHPHDVFGRQVAEEHRLPGGDLGLAVLGDVVRLDLAAEMLRHQLHAVADAERRHAELEHSGVDVRCAVGVHRCRPAGEDQRRRIASRHLAGREPVRDELRVDARLSDATRDELAVLAAEVEHEHRPLLGARLGRGERHDLGVLRHDGSWALPS